MLLCSYRIPPGTYRTSQSIGIFKSTNFTLFGNGAELIAENGSVNLDIFNNTNFVLQGPLVLDGVTLGFTQVSAEGQSRHVRLQSRKLDLGHYSFLELHMCAALADGKHS